MSKKHEILFNQLNDYRQQLIHLLHTVSEEQADMIPDGFHNNIRWNAGHIYLDQYLWIQHLTKEPIYIPEEYHNWFGHGTSPTVWQTSPPTMKNLILQLSNQVNYIKEKYGNRLEIEYAPIESGMQTLSQVLVRTIYHEGIHLSHIQLLKRFLECSVEKKQIV
ncbi:DinB family protein [Bacillus testis]|uniref:DinB family protein n=1 Tax=Bacillus testis TaxID=1622072 RepID=UPI00067F43AC|nr:DinB family protein [Bacillus testis]